jgi:hypothetical protein
MTRSTHRVNLSVSMRWVVKDRNCFTAKPQTSGREMKDAMQLLALAERRMLLRLIHSLNSSRFDDFFVYINTTVVGCV